MKTKLTEICQIIFEQVIRVTKSAHSRIKDVAKAVHRILTDKEARNDLKRHLTRYEKRIVEIVATVIFFVCLCVGAQAEAIKNEGASAGQNGAEQGTDSIIVDGYVSIERNPMLILGSFPDAAEDLLMGGHYSEPGEDIENRTEMQNYLTMAKKYASAKSIGVRYVSGTSVNFRRGPSLDSEIVTLLYRNTEVELLFEGGDGFSIVRYDGKVGYMYTEYLSETKIKVESSSNNKYGNISSLRELVAAMARDNQGTQPCISGYCAKWVSGIYQAAGCGYPGGNAIDYWTRWGSSGSTRTDNIPVGAVVVGSGSGSELGNLYGHVGIYIGNGMVADNIGRHRITTLEAWIAYNAGVCQGYRGFIGWVWPYGQPIPD